MKKTLILFGLMLLLCSCGEHTLATANTFADNRWFTKDVQQYKIEVDNDLADASVTISLGHLHADKYTDIPTELTMTYPDGTVAMFSVPLVFTDAAGKPLSDCAGDICDLHTVVKTGLKLPKGTYVFDLKNKLPVPYLPNIRQAGIEIKDAAPDNNAKG